MLHNLNKQNLHESFLSPLCWKAKKKECLVACGLSHVKQLMLKITHVSLKGPSHLWKLSRSSSMNSGQPRGHPQREDYGFITREEFFTADAGSVSGSACHCRTHISCHSYPDLPNRAPLTTFQSLKASVGAHRKSRVQHDELWAKSPVTQNKAHCRFHCGTLLSGLEGQAPANSTPRAERCSAEVSS